MILFLGGGPSQLNFLKAIKNLGHRLCVVDRNPECEGRKLADIFLNQSTWEGYDIAEALLERGTFPESEPNLIVANSGGKTTVSAWQISEKTGVDLFNHQVAMAAWSKYEFKNMLRTRWNLDMDTFLIDQESFDWPALARRFSGGLFIKPDINIVGKDACIVINRPDLCEPPDLDFKSSLNGKLVCETYYPEGTDYVLLGIIRNRKLIYWHIVEELNAHGDGVSNFGFRSVPFLEKELVEKCRLVTQELIDIGDIANSPLAVSLRVSENRIIPIELHLDFGGENIFLLATMWNNSDLVRFYISGGSTTLHDNDPDRHHNWILYKEKVPHWSEIAAIFSIEHSQWCPTPLRAQYVFSLDPTQSQGLKRRLLAHG